MSIFKRKSNRVLLPIVLIFNVSCASVADFVHKSIPIQEQITTRLEEISKIADEAVEKKIFTKTDRQLFAQNVMVPVITANRSYALCLRDGNCTDIPMQIKAMALGIQTGISDFVAKMAVTSTRDKLNAALQSTLIFINNIYVRK